MPAKLIWKGDKFRIVKRDTAHWREGVFDVEKRTEDALGNEAWHQVECYYYERVDAKTAFMVELIRFMDK